MLRQLLMAGVTTIVLTGTPGALHAQQTTPAQPRAAAAANQPLDLNTATLAELEKLPGVGPAMAARIVEYRQKIGGFKKIEDLMNVSGIGEKSFLTLKPLVVIAPPRAN
jgi:competence protein ComEA